MRLVQVSALLALASLALLSSCGTSTPPLSALGDTCYDAGDCESGVCERYQCSLRCTSDAECDVALPFCSGAIGACVADCGVDRSTVTTGVICVGGRETACSALDESYCDVCDDMCRGQRCVPRTGCAPLAAVGEPCELDDDCMTGNCSGFAGVCRVPLEQPCDDTNCDYCITAGSWSYCSRECGADYENGSCPEDRCLGYADQNHFWCRPDCESSCPGNCDFTTDGSIRYCRPTVADDWTYSSTPRALLAPCRYDSMCASGTCITATSCAYGASTCAGRRGYCSTTCDADSDCGAGGACVDLPCPAGSTTNCGRVCLPTCASTDDCNSLAEATCRGVTGVGGASVQVCDPRNENGARCSSGTQCASGTCDSMNRCGAAGGAANGASCGAPSDCMSNNCVSGTCRGTSLRGGPCETDFDCSVGTCASGICD